MNRGQKKDMISFLKNEIFIEQFLLFFHYRGLTDDRLYNLRKDIKAVGGNVRIAKNSLIKIAIKTSKFQSLDNYTYGPTAIVYGSDSVALSKIVVKSKKDNGFIKIMAGYVEGSILSEESLILLSKLGSLEELRSSFLGVLSGSQTKFTKVLKSGSGSSIVTLLGNYVSSLKN